MTDEQTAWISDLRRLADFFETNPQVIPQRGVHLYVSSLGRPEVVTEIIPVLDNAEVVSGSLPCIACRFGAHTLSFILGEEHLTETTVRTTTQVPSKEITAALAAKAATR